jgi:hypothetical protein
MLTASTLGDLNFSARTRPESTICVVNALKEAQKVEFLLYFFFACFFRRAVLPEGPG